jgi:hypothetical protein
MEIWLKLLKEVGFKVIQNKFEHPTFIKGESYPILICIKPLLITFFVRNKAELSCDIFMIKNRSLSR